MFHALFSGLSSSSSKMASLDRWSALWKSLGARGNSRGIYNRLAARYGEPHRAYHTFSHVEHCLKEFDAAKELTEHPLEVEFAIWFHDAVYDPRANDNEEKSAKLAQESAREMGLPDLFGARVADLVLISKHTALPQGIDAQIFIDIDLAIFGASKSLFDAYEQGVRKEYHFVPEAIFRARRAEILRGWRLPPTRGRHMAEARCHSYP